MERVLHRDQKLVFHRPILAGDKLFFDSYLDSVIESHGAVVTEIRGEVTDAEGNPVITSIVTVMGEAQSDDRGRRDGEQIARPAAASKPLLGKLGLNRQPCSPLSRRSVPAVGQQLVQRLLDGFANLVGQFEGDHRIVGADSS